MKKIQDSYKVVEVSKINALYFRMVIDAPRLAMSVQPGQFIHIKVSDAMEPLFRRPFSVYRAQQGKVEIFFEPVGVGSRLLTTKKRGDVLDILGPLGKPFTMPGAHIKQIVFVAGGIGVAPFMLFSDRLLTHKAEKILLYGGRTKAHTFPMKEFRKNDVFPFVSTDDGSAGIKGRVSVFFDKIQRAPTTMIYTCGPKPMMAAVGSFALSHGLQGEAALEEIMACGLGACLGCSTMTTSGYKTVCHDGPVFAFKDIYSAQAGSQE